MCVLECVEMCVYVFYIYVYVGCVLECVEVCVYVFYIYMCVLECVEVCMCFMFYNISLFIYQSNRDHWGMISGVLYICVC